VNAQDALLRLAKSDSRLYLRLLDRLSVGIGQRQWAADFELFLAVADPTLLIGSRAVRESLTMSWTAVLRRPTGSWAAPVGHWLDACADHRHRDPSLTILVAACAADSRVSGHLYRVALGWQRSDAHTPGTGADTVSCLLQKINAAQGIEPYEHAV
jgi:hypothetical protein